MSNELASIFAYIQEFMVGTAQVLPLGTTHCIPFHLSNHCEIAPPPAATMLPPIVTTTDDTRLTEDGIPATSLPAKFRMPDIERYSGIGCPKIHLRLYSTVMRVHEIDDAQLVALFPMSLSGVTQRCLLSMPTLMYLDEIWRPPGRGQMSLFLHLSVVGGQSGWISGVWFRQLLVLRRPLLEDYGQILFLFLTGHDTEHCAALHHAIHDLIDSKLVNLSGPSVTTNPLPIHSTHAVPLPPSLH
ncbi:hypothetical protein CK203_046227 [Vitis vinifera]|uniref:Uncharacterized protein n=1 Tax=Vitis vinifera TaxID=29760 RepID=A0A438HDH3_VITVI|nr:hypothetical protein CK203_046227 [Vitis vinifera]